jgi:hypothetical protein
MARSVIGCRAMASPRAAFVELDPTQLRSVSGGNDDDAFGRCGPGTQWAWLGNVYTPQCAAHDAAVRGALSSGSSHVAAHWKALPLLPAAIGSYVRARFGH